MSIQANFPALKPSLVLDFQNTKQLDPRITFTRASTASYYDGVTTSKAEENQLTYSNEISTARWVGAGVSTTINNSTSPDGTTTATLLTASAGADSKIRLTTTQAVSTTHTFSVYAKAGATSWLRLRNIGSNDCSGWFNLTTGVVGTVSGGTSAITSVGSGWYRCSITSTSASSIANNLLDMGAPSGDNTQASAGGETISVWGVQLEARSSVTALTVTTTQAITNYIPKLQSAASGVARFDNNPTTGESLGLLIEESRTNLLTYSSQFDNAAWTKARSTITADTVVSPDGTLNGDKLVEDTTASNSHIIYQGYTITAGNPYLFSMYAKAAERTKISITFDNVVFAFDLGAGTTASSNATITAVGNSWYRINCLRPTITTASSFVFISLADSSGATSYTGNGFSGLFIWGAQLEAGAFATSYIPTVASQVTRAADAASMTGTNFSTWYNAAEGTIYSEINNQNQGIDRRWAYLYDGSNGLFGSRLSSGNLYVLTAQETSGTSRSVNGATITSTSVKVANAYKVNDLASSQNGSSAYTGSIWSPISATSFVIGSFTTGGQVVNNCIKKIAYYPIRLSNTNLVALTS